MHSVLALTAMMASAAIANPLNHAQFHEKRQDVVDVVVTDVVYATAVVTAVVTATAGSEDVVDAASSAASAASVASVKVYSNNWGWYSHTWFPRPSSAASTSTTDAPAPVSTSSTPVAATSTVVVSSPTSTYVAPTTSAAPVTSAAPTTLASSTVASSTATGALTSYSDIALYHHNIHRSNHSAPAATWNATLVQAAQDWAQACNYSHNTQVGGGGYGQNIAAGVQADNVSAIITDLFYNGEVNWYAGQYGLDNPSFTNFEHWGHFSQIVWAESTTVGCYTQDCTGSGLINVGSDVAPYFTVCNYYPPGNMGGEYGDNIKPGTSDVSADWNTGL